jgi:hypothetical protein
MSKNCSDQLGMSGIRKAISSCASNQAACPVKTWHFTQEYARSREVDVNSAFIGSGKKKMTMNLIYHK